MWVLVREVPSTKPRQSPGVPPVKRLTRVLMSAALVAGAVVPAVVADAQEVPACVPSVDQGGLAQNVEHVCNIPDSATISVVFAYTDNFFYTSSLDTISVYSYDIDDEGTPSNINLRSTVPSANFENESVTYGERKDASGAVTERFVVLADDLFTISPTTQGASVGGDNIVIIDVTDPDGAFVRSENGDIPTGTHTVQCVDESQCDYAYTSGGNSLFSAVDMSNLDELTVEESLAELYNPAGGPRAEPGAFDQNGDNPEAGGSGHDWYLDSSGIMWAAGSGGLSAFDVTDPTTPRVLNMTDGTGNVAPLNNFILHNAIRPHGNAFAPNESPSLARGNIALATEEDYFDDGDEVDCAEAGLFQTWYIPTLDGSDVTGDRPTASSGTIRNLDSINAPLDLGLPAGAFCSAHWFDYNTKGFVAEGWYQGGMHVLDVRDPTDIKVHAYSYLGASEVWDSYWFPVRDANGERTPDRYDTLITADAVRGMDVYRILDLPAEPIEEIIPGPSTGGSTTSVTVGRIAGDDRIDTAVKASRVAFESADTALVARADDFPDALVGASLAAEVDGPILLTDGATLDSRVQAELDRLGVSKVYLLGGEVALAAGIQTAIASDDVEVERLDGADRFETAVKIADEVVELGGDVEQVAVALGVRPTGDAFPDALGGANLSMNLRVPILLTRPDTVPQTTLDAVESLGGGNTTLVFGGVQAITNSAAAQLEQFGDVERLAGQTRYGTATAILDRARSLDASIELDPLYLTSGAVFPDALAAAPAVFHLGGALLLVHPSDLASSPETKAYLESHKAEIGAVTIVGGTKAVTQSVESSIVSLLTS